MSYIWQPDPKKNQKTNIGKLMQKFGFEDYATFQKKSATDLEWFWQEIDQDLNWQWQKPYSKILSGDLPMADWFVDSKTNLTLNCIDKHQADEQLKKTALIWEGDDGQKSSLSYGELQEKINQLALGLKDAGIKPGDAAALYLPMIPEMVITFFALLKLGAVVVPVFSGYGQSPLAIRLKSSQAKWVFTANFGLRRGKKIPLKEQVDAALKEVASVKKVFVVKRTNDAIALNPNRDFWFSDLLNQTKNQPVDCEPMSPNQPGLIIYTSGTTGNPKGCVHTHQGMLAQVTKEVSYNLDCQNSDVFFWLTDIGWMMGPWEMIGVFFQGATLIIFEGAPNYPTNERLWQVLDEHQVSIFGISPTAIRLFKSFGTEMLSQYNFSNLRILGSTGEPWDLEAYQWFYEHVGQKRCPIINISGGTEIMGCHLAPVPIMPLKPLSLGMPGLGMAVDIFNEEGESVKDKNEVGYLVCKKPAPSMTRGFLNDQQRYLDTYFDRWPKVWNHGDWALQDENGQWFLKGRADDVIKVAGHRTGPAEIEACLMEHDAVLEAAVIGVPDKIKGQVPVAFVVLKNKLHDENTFLDELKTLVIQRLGKTLVPHQIFISQSLPKTRSAKILRGSIKKLYLGEEIKRDVAENPAAFDHISKCLSKNN